MGTKFLEPREKGRKIKMNVAELKIGAKYKCSCFNHSRVTLQGVEKTFPDGNALVCVLYRGKLYSVGSNNLFPVEKRLPQEPYKIGTLLLAPDEVAEIYQNEKYIVSGRKVYSVHYSVAQGVYTFDLLYTSNDALVNRGRFCAMDADGVNRLLGFSLLRVA